MEPGLYIVSPILSIYIGRKTQGVLFDCVCSCCGPNVVSECVWECMFNHVVFLGVDCCWPSGPCSPMPLAPDLFHEIVKSRMTDVNIGD